MSTTETCAAADELHWQAFCYVTGEMEMRQAAQFEDRLENDQAAREALAAALETLQLVTAAESLSPSIEIPSRKSARRITVFRSLAWMSLGAAAALLLAVGLPRLWLENDSDDWKSAGLTPELAVAWSQTELPQPSLGLLVPADAPQSHLSDNEDDHATDDAMWHIDSPHAAPAWMMAAVRGLSQDKSPDQLPVSPASPVAPVEMEN